jgi:hypothetical protein
MRLNQKRELVSTPVTTSIQSSTCRRTETNVSYQEGLYFRGVEFEPAGPPSLLTKDACRTNARSCVDQDKIERFLIGVANHPAIGTMHDVA